MPTRHVTGGVIPHYDDNFDTWFSWCKLVHSFYLSFYIRIRICEYQESIIHEFFVTNLNKIDRWNITLSPPIAAPSQGACSPVYPPSYLKSRE